MKTFFMLFTMIFYIVNATLIELNRKNKTDDFEDENKELKKWENVSNLILLVLLFLILIIICIRVTEVARLFNILNYSINLSCYTFVLINILLRDKSKRIEDVELQALTLIPLLVMCFYNLFENSILTFSNNRIEIFIIKNIIKYFILIFFISMDIFIFLKEFHEYKTKNKVEKKINKNVIKWNPLNYEYVNTKGKKGVLFVIGYVHDMIVFSFKLIFSPVVYAYYTFKFICVVIKKVAQRITQDFSMYVIIAKTFMISIIVSLLITYYKLLISYEDNINIEFYSVVITAIIIPIILEIISDLKNQ